MEPQGRRSVSPLPATKRIGRLRKTTRRSCVHARSVRLNAERKILSAPSRGEDVSLDIPLYRTASGQFLRPAASRLLLSRLLPNDTGPSHKAPARFGSSGLSLLGAPENGAEKGDIFMSYSVTIVGFVGADLEQRQARNNGAKV